MAWHPAPCLAQYRAEVNALWPNRDKTSDGMIGDAAHSARSSGHNPDPPTMVVRAWDCDKDGVDIPRILATFFRDPRALYAIWNGQIYLRANGFRPTPYSGANRHDKHAHLETVHTIAVDNDARPWGLAASLTSDTGSRPGGVDIPTPGGTLPAPIEEDDFMPELNPDEQRELLKLLREVHASTHYTEDQIDADGEIRGGIHQINLKSDATLAALMQLADLDEEKLAAALAGRLSTLVPASLDRLSDDDLAAIAHTVNDEADARARARLTTDRSTP